MCGDEGHDVAGLPLDKIQSAIQPNDEQRAALDDLANASTKAAQDITAACPTSPALTAPGRLDAMEKRIEVIAAAVQTIKVPLDRLYGLLNDEQKARLTALGQDQHRNRPQPEMERKRVRVVPPRLTLLYGLWRSSNKKSIRLPPNGRASAPFKTLQLSHRIF
jgi:uncharacterized protein YfaS (alpha-2-macroglobulin family)